MYDLHRLRLLVELSRRGTLSAVAAALNYSPSTISQQLSQLEAEVGTPLLEPIGRRVRLTPQAEILVAHTETVLRQLEAAETAVARSLTELIGRVRLATFQTGLLGLLSSVLTALDNRHPDLRVEVFQVEPQIALPRMLAHEYDMVIVEEFPHHPLPRPAEIDYRQLFLDPMRIAVPPGERVGHDVWAFVATRPWVAEPPGTAARSWIDSLCRDAGFEPDVKYTTADLLAHQQLITGGHAVGILPDLLGSVGPSAPSLIDIPDGPHARRILTATRRETAGQPGVEACRQALADATPAS